MSVFVGVDPGFRGAIAFLDQTGLNVHDMPITKSRTGKKIVDFFTLASLLAPKSDDPHIIFIENVWAMPREGVSGAFRFGVGVGALHMAAVGHGYEIHDPTPVVWKKYFGLSSDKGVSRNLASQRFPAQAHLFKRVIDDGRAEAALIALYAFEKTQLISQSSP